MRSTNVVKLAGHVLLELEHSGFSVDPYNNFENLDVFINAVGKENVTPKLSPKRNDFTKHECVWFCLSRHGEPFAVIACRYQDFGLEGISRFLKTSTDRQYGAGGSEVITFVASDKVLGISGRTAYIGELHVDKSKRGQRKVLKHFLLFVQLMAVIEWRVDHIFSLFRERDVLAKMPFLYGFTDCVPNVMIWSEDVEGRGSNESLASASKERIHHNADTMLRLKNWL
jgi:hypothetical protein